MKLKATSICLIIACLMGILLTGCLPNTTPIQEGVYESNNDSGNTAIPKMKVVLRQVTEQEFSVANGINAIKENDYSGELRYFLIEAYLYVAELKAYQQLQIVGCNQAMGASQTYILDIGNEEENYGVNQISFGSSNDGEKNVLETAFSEYRYILELVKEQNNGLRHSA